MTLLLPDLSVMKMGALDVSAVYLGSNLVWSAPPTGEATIGAGDTIEEAFGEWHTYPQATYIAEHDATYIGGIAGDGVVTANVFDHANDESRRVIAGTAVVDDHCRPPLWVMDGHRSVLGRNNHNNDSILGLQVGSVLNEPADLDSLSIAEQQTISAGPAISYGQIHRLASLSDADTDEFVIFARYYSSNLYTWRARRFSVDQPTGVVTWGSLTSLFKYSGTEQGYMNSVPANNAVGNPRLRLTAFYSPNQSVHHLYYFELDMVTGDVYDDDQTTVLGNLYTPTSMPIDVTLVTPAISAPAVSTRCFSQRPGPAAPAIAWGNWLIGSPYSGTMKLRTMTSPGVWGTDVDFGSAGQPIGYQKDKHYHSGFTFPNPDPDGTTLYIGRENRGTWTVERRTYDGSDWDAKTYIAARPSTEAKLARPECPINAADGGAFPVIVTEVLNYGGDIPVAYTVFDGNLIGLTGDEVPLIPFNTAEPTITTDGSPNTGETVTAVGGTWDNTPTLLEYAWARGTVDDIPTDSGGIPELLEAPYGTFASGNTSYTLRAGDELVEVFLVERATNAAGSNQAFSDSITPTAPPPPGSLVDSYVATGGVATTLASHTSDTGETWTKVAGSGSQLCAVTDRLRGSGTTSTASTYRSTWTPIDADYSVRGYLRYPSASNGMQIGIRVVLANGTDAGSGIAVTAGDGIFADHDVNNSLYRILKFIGGVQSTLASVASSGSASRYLRLEAVGTTFNLYEADTIAGVSVVGALVTSTVDTTFTAKGSAGTRNPAVSFSDSTRIQLEDLVGLN